MPITDSIELFFTASPRDGGQGTTLYALEDDGDVVEVLDPTQITSPLIGDSELLSMALDELLFFEWGGSLHVLLGGVHYAGGGSGASGFDSYFATITQNGDLNPLAFELQNITVLRWNDSHAVIGDQAWLMFGSGILNQYMTLDPDLTAVQVTSFYRENAPGVRGEITEFGEYVYFAADQQTPLGMEELWQIGPDGTMANTLNFNGVGTIADITVHDGHMWIAIDRGNGQSSELWRLDTPGGDPQEVDLPGSVGFPNKFVVLDGQLHLLDFYAGLFPLSPDTGVEPDSIIATRHLVRDVIEFNGDTYLVADNQQHARGLFQLSDAGLLVPMYPVAGLRETAVEELTVHNGHLYFRASTMEDDGFGGMAVSSRHLMRMDADGTVTELGEGDYLVGSIIPFSTSPLEPIEGGGDDDRLIGSAANDTLRGAAGNDTLEGGDGSDLLVGGDGNDVLIGGTSDTDLRDMIYGGEGNDDIDGGHGNDELRGDGGNDTIVGGFGVDDIFGGDGDDQLTGQAWSDLIFGGAGDDFINGGFGFDRVNGGDGADRFFHLGVADHGSDWIQDYDADQGDVLVFGGTAQRSDFQVNLTETANAGAAGTEEAFVIYRPTGQILWALVDGAAQDAINIVIGGTEYDLLS